MRKTITLLLLAIMLVGTVVQSVVAAGIEATLSTEVKSAKPGDTIDFTVTMSGDAACQSFGLVIQYDKAVFEVVKGKCSITGAWISTFDKDRGFVALYEEDTIPSGKIGTMVLKVKEGVPSGEAVVTFKTAAKTEKSEDVPLTSNSVTIKINGVSAPTVDATEPPNEKPTEAPVVNPTQPPEEKPTEAPAVNPTQPSVENPTEAPVEQPSDTLEEKPTEDLVQQSTAPSVQRPTEHKHTYSDAWSWDREQHWKVCTSCGEKKDVQDHTPGPEATEKDHQRCTVCQGVIKPALEHCHKYDETWMFDNDTHWHICECGEKAESAEHSWNSENICSVCSAIKKEDVSVDQPTTSEQPGEEKAPETSAPTESIPADDQGRTDVQWGIGALILVVVVALGVTAYIILAKKRQR